MKTDVIRIDFELSTIIISMTWDLDYRVLEREVAKYFDETNDDLFIFISQQCVVYKDNGTDIEKCLWGYFRVKSLEDFKRVIRESNREIVDKDVPEHIVDFGETIGNKYYMVDYLEKQFAYELEREMQEQYEREIREREEFEEWLDENFDGDGEYIGDL